MNLERNEDLEEPDRLLAWRTTGEFWGQERTVVVTHNPKTQRKKLYRLEEKLEKIRQGLLEFRKNFREQQPHWRDFRSIVVRYGRMCEKLHVGTQYFTLVKEGEHDMSFRKDLYQISKAKALMGRNIIVTDNADWSTEDIVRSSLERWKVEKCFRDSKNPRHVSVNPIFHWTDGKIRCHLLCCVIALCMQRFLEMKVQPVTGNISGEKILEEMATLHEVVMWRSKKSKPVRQLTEPAKLQNDVLKAFGWHIDASSVLQPLD